MLFGQNYIVKLPLVKMAIPNIGIPALESTGIPELNLISALKISLPPIKEVSNMIPYKVFEKAQQDAAMRNAFELTRLTNKRSKAIAKARGRMLERYAQNYGKR